MNVICFSHLRWDFVFQRPQHLMTRLSAGIELFYIEEPVFSSERSDRWEVRAIPESAVKVMVPVLSELGGLAIVDDRLRLLLDAFIREQNFSEFLAWYYSPMSLSFSDHLRPAVIVYDCMDELSAFLGASPELVNREKQLLGLADIVFTGGQRLYEAKKKLHQNIFPFPSSIDKEVFAPARWKQDDPSDQASIAHPRLGFFGVLDERFDTRLVKEIAEQRPDWQLVFIGPVVKIDAAQLPKLPNIHYLGMKNYKELPGYIAGWDICIMPFAINASTEYISPTKTPEFLAAGKRVVSTPIHDVVHPYADKNLVGIGESAADFVRIVEEYFESTDEAEWLRNADDFLADMSWDKTFLAMKDRIDEIIRAKSIVHHLNEG